MDKNILKENIQQAFDEASDFSDKIHKAVFNRYKEYFVEMTEEQLMWLEWEVKDFVLKILLDWQSR